MKGRPVENVIYDHMFPKPRNTDPCNFNSLLQRHLIPEVRQEVHSFYGHLDTPEAKYPGLDYTDRIHRIRLSRWTWHRRLFRAVDSLGLTNWEISNLTKWEGTKWAKERYEQDCGVIIKDSVLEEIGEWVAPGGRTEARRAVLREESEQEEDEDEDEDAEEDEEEDEDDATTDEQIENEDESDGELGSIGVELNERLRERAARHHAGDTSEPLDEEWEQWLKNAIEAGEIPFMAEQMLQESTTQSMLPAHLFPPHMLSAARAGQWSEVPEFLHDMLRRTIDAEPANTRAALSDVSVAQPHSRRTYSDLRLPVGPARSQPSARRSTNSEVREVRLRRLAESNA